MGPRNLGVRPPQKSSAFGVLGLFLPSRWVILVSCFVRSEKLQNESSRTFRIFVPNFAPNFAPNFSRIFRGFFVLHFVGDGDQQKFTNNPRHFSMQNSQANTKKILTEFFWRAGKAILPKTSVMQMIEAGNMCVCVCAAKAFSHEVWQKLRCKPSDHLNAMPKSCRPFRPYTL